MDNVNIANHYAAPDQCMYHIGLSQQMTEKATVAIVTGDPGRVAALAKYLDQQAVEIAYVREYRTYLAHVANRPVLIASTGIGCPSLAIALEEFAMIGVKQFIRVGTTGAIQPWLDLGDIILSSAAVRLDGTSTHYAPLNYPAVADFELNRQLVNSAEALGVDLKVGITASSDTFWPGQERYGNYSGYVLPEFQGTFDQWQKLNVLNFEMESAALFTIASAFGLQAACLCGVLAQRGRSETVDKQGYDTAMESIMKVIGQILK